ncbi:hypothetical protein [Glycomyces buryatensis]|uniref:DUF3592 domain-containing protein n=1 Tax=Glycomyces buryatensis TaxID=2570927 RepID=A0A4S8PXL0_9ACTN|nr:hypothetical protein [Glycomyces buryatensis]THV36443.1 hypothetical protein FAB82_21900 [Glycomyces buryatensis]
MAALLVPVLWLAVAASAMWLDDDWHSAVQFTLTLLNVFISAAVLLICVVLWFMVVDTVTGYVAMGLACAAILVGAHLAFGALELWLLEWRGTATACTVLEVRPREGVETAGGGGQAPQYYDYRMDCAEVDAPQAMTTHMPVRGDRITVVYDPDRLVGARAAVEVEAAAARTGIAGLATAVWTALTIGFILLRTPFTGRPDPLPGNQR